MLCLPLDFVFRHNILHVWLGPLGPVTGSVPCFSLPREKLYEALVIYSHVLPYLSLSLPVAPLT